MDIKKIHHETMKIIIIAAISSNGIIGNNNNMLWSLPNDIKRFKNYTIGHTVIMGRKTFESINQKPLIKRNNIIITHNKNYYIHNLYKYRNNIKIFYSITECIFNLKKKNIKKVFIIGGGEIYKQFINIANILELTIVHQNFDGDIKFPYINISIWKKINEIYYKKDKLHNYNYSYITYINKKNTIFK